MATLTIVETEIALDNSILDIRLSDKDKERSLKALEKHLRKGYIIPLFSDEGLTLNMEEPDLFKEVPAENIHGGIWEIVIKDGKAMATIQCDVQDVDKIRDAKLIFVGKYINLGLPQFLLSNSVPEFVITGAVIR